MVMVFKTDQTGQKNMISKAVFQDIEQPMRPMLQHTDPLLSLAEILCVDTLDDDLEPDTHFAFNDDSSQSDAGDEESFATHQGYKTPATLDLHSDCCGNHQTCLAALT